MLWCFFKVGIFVIGFEKYFRRGGNIFNWFWKCVFFTLKNFLNNFEDVFLEHDIFESGFRNVAQHRLLFRLASDCLARS